jgi:hypothetical protein
VGTSSARKAPVGKFWRTAKTSASRFASGKEATPPQVQEVVTHYLTALKSHDPDAVGGTQTFLPDLVRTAASLGDFYRTWQQHGWDAALGRLGLDPAGHGAREAIMPALLDELAGTGARLDEAVSRAALIDHLVPVIEAGGNPDQAEVLPSLDSLDIMALVRHFLGMALYRKWQSDLGEPLEFHAPTIPQGVQRQEELKAYILANLALPATGATETEAFSLVQTATLLERLIADLGGRHES